MHYACIMARLVYPDGDGVVVKLLRGERVLFRRRNRSGGSVGLSAAGLTRFGSSGLYPDEVAAKSLCTSPLRVPTPGEGYPSLVA